MEILPTNQPASPALRQSRLRMNFYTPKPNPPRAAQRVGTSGARFGRQPPARCGILCWNSLASDSPHPLPLIRVRLTLQSRGRATGTLRRTIETIVPPEPECPTSCTPSATFWPTCTETLALMIGKTSRPVTVGDAEDTPALRSLRRAGVAHCPGR
jgi:hypothetical protein